MEKVKTGLFLEVVLKQLCERYECKYTSKISRQHLKMLDIDLEEIIKTYFESK